MFRKVDVSFWQDSDMIELTPEGKYFYLYILTNPHTTLCGIYEISKRVMSFETGFNIDTIDKLIRQFEEKGKIIYDPGTCEIFIKNWYRYNFTSSPKVIKGIIHDLKKVKSGKLLTAFWNTIPDDVKSVLIEYGYPIDTLSIPYGYPMDTDPHIDIDKDLDIDKDKEIDIDIEYRYPMDTVSIPYHSKNQDQTLTQVQPQTKTQFSPSEEAILKIAGEIRERLKKFKAISAEAFDFLEEPADIHLDAVNRLLEELGQEPIEKLTNGELLEIAEAIRTNRTDNKYFVKIVNTKNGLIFNKCLRGSS